MNKAGPYTDPWEIPLHFHNCINVSVKWKLKENLTLFSDKLRDAPKALGNPIIKPRLQNNNFPNFFLFEIQHPGASTDLFLCYVLCYDKFVA